MKSQGPLMALSFLVLISTARHTNRSSGPGHGEVGTCGPQDTQRLVSEGQTCSKPCRRDRECGKRRCLGDGACGCSCISPARQCLWPMTVPHASVRLLSGSRPTFGKWMEVVCDAGFKLRDGGNISRHRCQGDQRWSHPQPECQVDWGTPRGPCGDPPALPRGVYEGLELSLGRHVRYRCYPGHRLHGHETNTCLTNGTWERPAPVCKAIFCPPPSPLAKGLLVTVEKPRYRVNESVFYLCRRGYTLEGAHQVSCAADGAWSAMPRCQAMCDVIPHRSRVLYQGRKVWLSEIPGRRLRHLGELHFFCWNATGECNYPARAQCIDGSLQIPLCYREPTWVRFTLFHWKVVSELEECAQEQDHRHYHTQA